MQENNKHTFLPQTKVHPTYIENKFKNDVDEPSYIGTKVHLECPVNVGGQELWGHVFKTYYGWEGHSDRLCPTQRYAGQEFKFGVSMPKTVPCTAFASQFSYFTENSQLSKPTNTKKDDKK